MNPGTIRGSAHRLEPQVLTLIVALVIAGAYGQVPQDKGRSPTGVLSRADNLVGTRQHALLAGAPPDAVPVPADYDGDGFTDFALKGSNGIWYIDMAACSGGRCLGSDGFGGRWDFAYPGYGDATAIPVPADYGRVDGSVDPEHKVDLAVKNASGMWAIDYADNGFGSWDIIRYGYGDSTATPVPADYDGDGRADIAIKTTDGLWYIDIAADGFGAWDSRTPRAGYGNADAIPVPADYDGDGCADLAVKDPHTTPSGGIGTWYIDYARDGANPCGLDGFRGWDSCYSGYGNTTATPVPADYDGDTKADLAIKDIYGTWYIDYASNGFGGWDASAANFGGTGAKAIPGHYDLSRSALDKRLDLSYADMSGYWRVNLVANGYGINAWDVIPGTSSTWIYNPSRPIVNVNQPYIESTIVYLPIDASSTVPRGTKAANELTPQAPLINGHYQLRIGVRYTVAVRLNPGAVHHIASVWLNPDLHVPSSLKVINPLYTTYQWITSTHTRAFAVTCTQPGTFPLGFMLLDGETYNWVNPDYGIRVACTAEKTGLYGTVTTRLRDANARYVSSAAALGGVTVRVSGPVDASVTTLDGHWSFPALTGGPYQITFTAANKTPLTAVNVNVPAGSGAKVDAALETAFTKLGPGITYKQYLDYSRGRTLLHVVRADTTRASVRLAVTDMAPNPEGVYEYVTLLANAQLHNAPVAMNGGYFDPGGELGPGGNTVDGRDDEAVGYFYGMRPSAMSIGYVPSLRLATSGEFPMLAITGLGTNQQIKIRMTEADFLSSSSSQWTQTSSGPIFDAAPPKAKSDVNYAMQMEPLLVMNGQVVAAPDMAWARTTIGKNGDTGTIFWLVVADGEGVNGGNGAQFDQLGSFYRYVLGATEAMALDGGLSTELVLRETTSTWRNVNTITGEDSSWDIDPAREGEVLETVRGPGGAPGLLGGVFNYLTVGN